MTSYDAIPYPSYCYPSCDPARLCAIGNLFGLDVKKVTTANILEIGCASGGNILPLASRYPGAQFLGVDMSIAQIGVAKTTAKELQLENIRFEAASILDYDFTDQLYDYVIVHGIYSWVPEVVRGRIFEICKSNLTPSGITYISYNTLPGWNVIKTVRDMMLYHSDNFTDPYEKVLEARRMLNFVAENNQVETGAYKKIMEDEITSLQNLDDNYLLHDHLEAINDPCYFHEFMTAAGEYGLQYLGESELPTMFLGNQKEQAAHLLAELTDPVRQEQYVDFIINRRFRMTLLTHSEALINRNVTPKSVENAYFYSLYNIVEQVSLENIHNLESLKLAAMTNHEVKASITGNIICVCYFELLNASPLPLSLSEIVERASKQLPDIGKTNIRNELDGIILKLLFKGIVTITTEKPSFVGQVSEKPKVFDVALTKSKDEFLVPNLCHKMIGLSEDQRIILKFINGENTVEQIRNSIRNLIANDEFLINKDGKPVTQEAENFDEYLRLYVDHQLKTLCQNALLVS